MVPLIEQRRQELARLCATYHVQRLELFGSAAAGRLAPEQSDLDFLVQFLPMPPIEHADSYFGLLEELERLFGRPVDLVEQGAVHNPFFLRDLEASRQLLYAA
jgi:predicted nucleotidyltransferase